MIGQEQINEEWKSIKGYPLYAISNLGRVKSLARFQNNGFLSKQSYFPERILTSIKAKNGYLKAGIRNEGKQILASIHRLVAIHFLDNSLNLPEVNHLDGNKSNNKVNNLEWSTKSHNELHARDTGLKRRNVTHCNAKINIEIAENIREESIFSNRKELAIKYNLSYSQIGAILTNKKWIKNKKK